MKLHTARRISSLAGMPITRQAALEMRLDVDERGENGLLVPATRRRETPDLRRA